MCLNYETFTFDMECHLYYHLGSEALAKVS